MTSVIPRRLQFDYIGHKLIKLCSWFCMLLFFFFLPCLCVFILLSYHSATFFCRQLIAQSDSLHIWRHADSKHPSVPRLWRCCSHRRPLVYSSHLNQTAAALPPGAPPAVAATLLWPRSYLLISSSSRRRSESDNTRLFTLSVSCKEAKIMPLCVFCFGQTKKKLRCKLQTIVRLKIEDLA